MTNENRFAIVVHACDRYEFLFKGFHYFFMKHWGVQPGCNVYFISENKDISLPGLTNIKSGSGPWSDRLRNALGQLEEEYVIYIQEDAWLAKPVDRNFFAQLFDFIERHPVKVLKLHSSDIYVTEATGDYIDGLNIAKLDMAKSRFLMSHQISLWNREFLMGQLPAGEHPWRNERKGTKRLKALGYPIYHIDYFSDSGKEAINKNRVSAPASLYYTVSTNSMLRDVAMPFIEELWQKPETREYAEALKHHFDNRITHDGQPGARKTGVWDKAKKWVRNALPKRN